MDFDEEFMAAIYQAEKDGLVILHKGEGGQIEEVELTAKGHLAAAQAKGEA